MVCEAVWLDCYPDRKDCSELRHCTIMHYFGLSFLFCFVECIVTDLLACKAPRLFLHNTRHSYS